jgi:phosphoglycolate phosphatase-like HAD superfamily hydrolase
MAAIAFDLDGTLITCESRHSAVLRAAISRYGLANVDLTAIWLAKRNGASTMEALASLNLDQAILQKVGATWSEMIESPSWLMLDASFVDTVPTLHRVRKRGFRTILLTARQKPHWLKVQLKWLQFTELFDTIEIVAPSEASKQKAEILNYLRPTAFFGDTESDWLAARQGAIPFVALGRGQRSAAFLERLGIQPVWGNLRDAMTHALAHCLNA